MRGLVFAIPAALAAALTLAACGSSGSANYPPTAATDLLNAIHSGNKPAFISPSLVTDGQFGRG